MPRLVQLNDSVHELVEIAELDQLGNWSNLVDKSAGTTDLDQDRAHNSVNEIDDDNVHADGPAGITTTTGTNWADPEYDAAGNMTTVPQIGDPATAHDAVYDAWNRLVEYDVALGVPKYEYDGLNQLIVNSTVGSTHYYYNDKWQVIVEERSLFGSEPEAMYAWHPYYIDALAVRFRADDRHAFLHDANFNVTAAYDVDSGSGAYRTVVERYGYTPYGEATILDANFTADADNRSDIGNNYLYTGRERDSSSKLQINRHRWYHAGLGRWPTRDPIGYRGGMNLYLYTDCTPLVKTDPTGEWPNYICWCGLNCNIGCLCIRPGVCGLGAGGDAEDAQGRGIGEADREFGNGNRRDVRHRALRHCIASGILASRQGCICASCVGWHREAFQNECFAQDPREGERGEFNNGQGRLCAGCKSWGRGHIGGGTGKTDDEIVQCCKDRLNDGDLDTD